VNKTLAKLANHLAKKHAQFKNVYEIRCPFDAPVQAIFESVDIGKVWGIGKRLAASLQAQGYHTVAQLQKAPAGDIRRRYGVVVERTLRELNGEVCFDLQQAPEDKKQMIASRSFGQPVYDLSTLERAVLSHLTRVLQTLRAQNSLCRMVTIFIRNNRFSSREPFLDRRRTLVLVEPTDNLLYLAKSVRQLLAELYQSQVAWHKAGVILGEIIPKAGYQPDLFAPQNSTSQQTTKQQKMLSVIDQLNQRYGKQSLFIASAGPKHGNNWQMLRQRMSPRYTTHWQELPIAWAK